MADKPKITTLILDPKWELGAVHMDGIDHAFLRFIHPQFGQLDFHLPHETVGGMLDGLTKLKAQLSKT